MQQPTYIDMTDDELVELANRDENAVAFLLNKYKPLVRARSRSYFLAGADNEDIMQEGMIGLYKAIRDYKQKVSSFAAFADLCIKRQIISAIKTANRQKHKPLNSYISLSRPVYGDEADNELVDFITLETISDPEEIFMDNEQYSAIRQAITVRLSRLELRVLTLYLQGLSYTEIATQTNRPEKSVDNALQRIKAKLAELLP